MPQAVDDDAEEVDRLRQVFDQATSENSAPHERLLAAGTLRELLVPFMEHQVDAARAQGHTWADVGKVLGITKQAAAQRFGSRRTLVYDTSEEVAVLREATEADLASMPPDVREKIDELRQAQDEN